MRLLVFNLATDADDPVLGFTSRWIAALAARTDRVDVVTMRRGRTELPPNVRVYSVGKERGASEGRRAVEFFRILRRLLAEGRVDACFSHMIPLFTVMAAPLLRPRGVPIVTWYTHRQVTSLVKLAYHLSTRMVTASEDSFGYKRDRLVVLGHGIDTDVFRPGGQPDTDPPLVLSVGRLSPIKRTLALVDAMHVLRRRGVDFRCAIVGPVIERDRGYAADVAARICDLGLGDRVTLVGAVPHAELAAWYRRCTVHVNLSPRGLFDKTALEAMACGRPSLVAHDGFGATLGSFRDRLLLPAIDADAIAARTAGVLELEKPARESIGAALRREVAARHGLDGLSDRLITLLRRLSPTTRAAA